MKLSCIVFASSAVFAVAELANAQASFHVLGLAGTRPTAVSSDGAWITGAAPSGAFRWSAASGISTITNFGGSGTPDIASGGNRVALSLLDLSGNELAAVWTPSGTTFIPGLGGQSGTSIGSAWAANSDASVVVGLGWINAGTAHAFKWTQSSGISLDLGALGGNSSRANGVSDDGTVVTGWDEDPTGFRRPCFWSGGTETLIDLNPGEADALTPNGSVITGISNGDLMRWTSAGMVTLGKLPNSDPFSDEATGLAISADGNTIVGSNGNGFFGTPFRAFIWRPGAGMVEVKQLLVALGATTAANYDLSSAVGVSADGRTLVGGTGAFPFGPFDTWVARLPLEASSYCTAKVNSQGCTPAIGFSGTPSASSGAGFHVSATNIVPNKNGLLFYSISGPAATSFQGGFLCMNSPIKRTAVQVSGGSAACSGSFDIDFNAYIASGVDATLIGGAHVWAQYWSRDPASASTTNLTNALAFTLWP